MAREPELDPPELLVAVALVEPGRLKAARLHDRPLAAAPPGLLLDGREEPGPQGEPSGVLRHIEHVEEQQAEFGPVPQAAQDSSGRGIGKLGPDRGAVGHPGSFDVVPVEGSPRLRLRFLV
jgi:hypothetical protein